MSTSPANPDASVCSPAAPDDGAGQMARPLSGRGTDEITVVQVPGCPPVPGFLTADAARPVADGAQPPATPTLEAEVKKLQAALHTAARSSPVKRLGRRDKLRPGAVRGSAAPGLLSRRSFRGVGMALATVMIAAAVGAFVFVVLPQTDEWELAELRPVASPEPSAPPATAVPPGSEAGVTASEAARQSQPTQAQPTQAQPTQSSPLPQPVAPLPPVAPPASQPIETPIEVAPLLMTDDSHAAPAPAAIPEPSAMTASATPPAAPDPPAPAAPDPPAPATPAPPAVAPTRPEAPVMAAREPVRPAGHEPQAEWPAANRMPPGVGMAAAPHGGSNFQSADSSARYPTGAEQKLSVDRLHTARNEIFVRKGFKDDALRVYPGAAELEAARVAATDPHREYLTRAQLQRLSPEQLVLVRNEILARRGRYFKDPALRVYFEQFAWYRPYAWVVPLTPVERANVDLIWSYQQTMLAPGPAARPWRAPPM
jgi:hypothetical protein